MEKIAELSVSISEDKNGNQRMYTRVKANLVNKIKMIHAIIYDNEKESGLPGMIFINILQQGYPAFLKMIGENAAEEFFIDRKELEKQLNQM